MLDAAEVGEVAAEKNQIDVTQVGQFELGLTGPVKIDEAEDLEGAGLGFFAGHGQSLYDRSASGGSSEGSLDLDDAPPPQEKRREE